MLALLLRHDRATRARHAQAPAVPAEHRVVQIQIGVRRWRGDGGRGALHVAFIGDLQGMCPRPRELIGAEPPAQRMPLFRAVIMLIDAVAAD